MTRIKEEVAKRGLVEGVREAVVRTGGVISSCGLIMAGAFCSMMAGSLAVVVELGFAVAAGILLDTFIVRPVMVPAIVLLWERDGQIHPPPYRPTPRLTPHRCPSANGSMSVPQVFDALLLHFSLAEG